MHDRLGDAYAAAERCRLSPWNDNLPLVGFYESLALLAKRYSGSKDLATLYDDFRQDLLASCQATVSLTLKAEVEMFDELMGPYRKFVIRNMSKYFVPGNAKRESVIRSEIGQILEGSSALLETNAHADNDLFSKLLTDALESVEELRSYIESLRETLHQTRTAMDQSAASRNASRAVLLAVLSMLVAVLSVIVSIFGGEIRRAILTGEPLGPLMRQESEKAKGEKP